MSLQQIFDLNNEGARVLASGKPTEALLMFAEAQMIANHRCHALLGQPRLLATSTMSIVSLEVTSTGAPPTISVPKAQLCIGASSVEDESLCYAIVHFNTGLALQYQADSKQDQRMGMAIEEYKRCLQSLMTATTSADPAVVIGLSVAAIANLAEIMFDMDRLDKAASLMKMCHCLLETNSTVPNIDDEVRQSIAHTLHFFCHCCEMRKRGAPAA
jgi:hypothetical protein